MSVGVIAKLRVKEGMNREFETVFRQLSEAVLEGEPGCNYYELHKSNSDKQLYIVLEQYADEDALAEHEQTEHMKLLGARLAPFLQVPADVEIMISV